MQAADSMLDFFKKCLEDESISRRNKIENLSKKTAHDLLWRLQELNLYNCKIGEPFLLVIHPYMPRVLDSPNHLAGGTIPKQLMEFMAIKKIDFDGNNFTGVFSQDVESKKYV